MIRKILGLVLMVNLVYVAMGVAKYGSQHVDAYGIWMLKAKAWIAEGGVPLKLLSDPKYSYSHQQYPLLLPAMMAGWTRLTGNLESFLWLYPLIYVSILLILNTLLRLERVGKTTALAWTTVASFMGPLMAQGGRLHAGLADIWICWLVGLGMLAVRKKSLWGLAVAVMVASQIKTEGIFLLALYIGIAKPWRQKIRWMLVSAIPFVWWQWQVRAWGIPSDIGFFWPGWIELIRRLGLVVTLTAKEMLNWRNWYVVWLIWWLNVFQIMLSSIRKSTSSTPASGVRLRASFAGIADRYKLFILMGCGYIGVYLFSRLEPAAYVSSSIDRLLLQTLPLWWTGMTQLCPKLPERVFCRVVA